MPELNLDRRLEALAGDAGRIGRLDSAVEVRVRGDRRRRRRYAGSAVLGMLLAAAFGTGIALAQPKQSPAPPAVSPSPAVSPTRSPSPAVSPPRHDDSQPGNAVKAPPPYSAAFDGPPPVFPTTAPTTIGEIPAIPSPPPQPSAPDDPADR
jgi:hypothetical protein